MKLIDKAMKLMIQVAELDKDWNGSKYEYDFIEMDALREIKKSIEIRGAYDFAKTFNVLVNNSAEDFMIEFYTTFNDRSCGPRTY